MDTKRAALPHVVYRMYDLKDRLLYVGMTLFFESRMREHERYQPWYPMVARIAWEVHPNRGEAEKVENEALLSEFPIFNVMGTTRGKRGTGLRTVSVPNDPWYLALLVAHDLGVSIDEAVTDLLSEYVSRNRHLLDEATEDE